MNWDGVLTSRYAAGGRTSIPPERLQRFGAPDRPQRAQRPVADGGTGLQPAVSLVRRLDRTDPFGCSEYSALAQTTISKIVGLVPDEVATAATTTYIHTDALHSPVAETNGAGTVTLRTRYEPYGKTLMPPVQGQGYAGQVVDVSTGLS